MEVAFNLEDDTESDESELPVNEFEPNERSGHAAVCLNQYLFVFGGYHCLRQEFQGIQFYREEYVSHRTVWMYNLDSERWKVLSIKGSDRPPGTSGACAVAIGKTIYMQGGHTVNGNTNALWTLSLIPNKGLFWDEIKIGYTYSKPSPRDKHAGWEYDDKLWTFAGFGPPLSGYMSDYGEFVKDLGTSPTRGWNNQVHCFDPSKHEWTNVKPKGAIPSPRAAMSVAALSDRVLFFGGRHGPNRLDDCYEFNLKTLTFTCLKPKGIEKPVGRSWHSFNTLSNEFIVLHGGYSNDGIPLNDTWLLHLPTLTWSRYSVKTDHHRLWHTGTSGHQSVIIFGGCKSDILSVQDKPDMCNDIFIIQVSPDSLVKQAIRTVFKYRKVLEEEWDSLPVNLYAILQEMCTTENEENVEENKSSEGRVVTCSIS